MMKFRVRPKKARKTNQSRLRIDLKNLREPDSRNNWWDIRTTHQSDGGGHGQNIAQNYTTLRVVVPDCSQSPEEDLPPILREEVEMAVASLKTEKSAGVDNIHAKLV